MGGGEVNVQNPHPRPKRPIIAQSSRSTPADTIPPMFKGEKAFVMATGPSLDDDVIDHIYGLHGWRYIGISDCYRICPFLDFFYACDDRWWNIHYSSVMYWAGCENGYWCTEQQTQKKYTDLYRISGRSGDGWSTDPALIHYGSNSGYQITNCALHLGVTTMILLGFNMQMVANKKHFFGDHPQGLAQNSSYQSFASAFNMIKPAQYGVDVINATPQSALTAFPKMSLDEAIAFAEEKHG